MGQSTNFQGGKKVFFRCNEHLFLHENNERVELLICVRRVRVVNIAIKHDVFMNSNDKNRAVTFLNIWHDYAPCLPTMVTAGHEI